MQSQASLISSCCMAPQQLWPFEAGSVIVSTYLVFTSGLENSVKFFQDCLANMLLGDLKLRPFAEDVWKYCLQVKR